MKTAKNSARVKLNLVPRVALLVWIVMLALPSAARTQQTAAPKRILKLYWYDPDYPESVKFHQSFQAALQSAPAGTVEYYPEYLESDRFPGENQSLLLRDYLRQKYADRTIDVVVASPDPPLNFLLRYRDDLFPTAPLVFSSVSRPSRDELSAGAGATGVIQLTTHRQTLDLALRLHPDTKQVVIIGGTLEHTKLETLAREALQGYESKVQFTYLTDLTPDELISKTKNLPERSIILYIWQQSVNKNGKLLESADLLALIAQSAPVPIYGLASSSLGYGIIGGYVSTTEAIATRVAEIALRIANGECAPDIPIESAPAAPTFDWRQLQRWRISEDRLPPGSIVRFRQLTFWEHYKWYIVGVLALCALQALLISILLIERARRRRAKVGLDERLQFETLVSELSAELMTLPAHEVDHGIDEGLKRLGGFLGVNDGAFLELSKSDAGVSQDESTSAVLGSSPLTGIPDEQRHWCMSKLRSGATVNLSAVAEVTPEEVGGGKSSLRTGVKSLLAIPIAANGSVCALAFARAECHRDWPEDLIPRLRLAGEIFANALVRKKQEEALRASEERYRAFFELAAVGTGQASPDEGRFLRINEAHCRITGHTREELLAMKFSDITHPEDREKDLEKFRRLIRGEVADYTSEKRYLRKDGNSVWVQVDVSLVRDTQGRPLHTVAIVQDIDARKRAQQALAQSEDFNRRIIESSPDCMAILDLGGNLRYLNPRGQQLMEIDDFSIYRDSPWLNLWQGEGQQAADSAMQQARSGAAATFQAFCPTAAGAPKWWDVLISPMRDTQGDVERLLAVSRDITRTKQTEDALRQSERRFRQLAENIAAVFFVTERGSDELAPGKILYVSPAYETIWGRSCESLYQDTRSWFEAVHPKDRERVQAAFSKLATGEFDEEFQIIQAGGAVRWVHTRTFPVFDEHGEIYRVAGIVNDTTERKQVEAKFRALLEAAPDAMVIVDSQGEIVLVNSQAEKLFGYTRQELLGKKVEVLVPERLRDAHTAHRSNFASRAQFRPMGAGLDLYGLRKNGDEFPVEISLSPLQTEQGTLFSSAIRDITERKKTEEMLRDREERLRLACEAGRMGVWDWNLVTGEVTWSKHIFSILGFKPFSIQPNYRNWVERIHPDDLSRVEEAINATLRGTENYQSEYRIQLPDGTIRWAEGSGRCTRNEAGDCISMQGLMIDITERKQAENALRESEQRYRNVVETQTELICRNLPDTTLTFVNDAYCRYFKRTREQLIGSKFIDLVPEPVRPQVLQHIEALTEHPHIEISEHEHEVIMPDGSIGWHSWVNRKILDAAGRVTEVQGIGRDITASKLAEKKLRESEERYRNVVETQTELICRYECDTTLTFVNDAYCRYFGKTREQLIGMKFLELLPEEARPMAIAHVESLLADPRIEMDEHQVIRADGTIGWQEWVDYAIRDGDGPILEMQAIGRDITERKRLEEELEGREREFARLVENSPDIISRLDRNLRYLYISPIVERVLGTPPRQFIGKTTREIDAPPHDWDAFETSCRQALETGAIVDREFSYAGRHYHSRLIPEIGTNGSVDTLLCISEDITARRRSERELVQISARFLGLQEEERRRIGRQLHDVTAQNLFATTINLAHLQSNSASSETKKVLAECQSLCEQALQEIRTLSYLLYPPVLDQAGLISALGWYIDGFSKRSGIDVGLVITEEFDRLQREVEADLFRIVQESLSNVHRHSGSNTASVRLEKQTSQVVLQIRDEGRGIQPRVTPAETEDPTVGVGIPSMRQRLRQLGGHLTIESNSQGTVVTATVPLHVERRRASRAVQG